MTRSTQFDEISRAFGRIEAKLDAAVVDIGEVKEEVSALKATVAKGDAEFEKLRNKGTGILIGVGIAAGSLGASLDGIWKALTA